MTRDELGRSLQLEVDLLDPNRPNVSYERMVPRTIIVHNTGNRSPGADAHMHARYLRGPEARRRKVSWHYTVDDQRVVKHLPLTTVGWHAGDANANSTSIGVEVCMHEGIDQAAADDRAARLIAALLHDFAWTTDAVRTHESVTGKRCPSLLLPTWAEFIGRIDRYLQELDMGPVAVISGAIKASEIFALIPAITTLIQGILEQDPEVTDEELIQQVDDMVRLNGLAEVISDLIIRGAVGIARWKQRRQARRS